MTEFRHYHIKFLDNNNEKLSPEEYNDVMHQTEFLKFTRGHFLDFIIEVEMITDIIIENYMLHKKSNLKGVFRKNITNNKNITLKQKIELLCEIINEKKELNENDLKTLKNYLNSLREERNKWAHGVIHFKQEKRDKKIVFQSYLVWVGSEGNESQLKLTNSYFDDLTHKFQTNQKFLVKILVKRKLLSRDYLFKK